MKLKNIALALLLTAGTFTASVNATTIDFRALPDGTTVTNQYPDFTASLSGGNAAGNPTTAYYGGGLSNSPTAGQYPTAEFLNITFTSPVDALSFIFDNEGYNGGNEWYAYDSTHALLQSGALNTSSTISVSNFGTSGVEEISFSNGYAAGQRSWTQALSVITYDVKPVPEPGVVFLVGAGLLGLFAARRRKSA